MGKHNRLNMRRENNLAVCQCKNGLRMTCAILCLALLLGLCVGCIAYDSTGDAAELQNGLDDALNERDSINKQYATALQELDALKNSYEQVKSELEELKVAHEETKEELAALDRSHQAKEEEIATLNQTNAATKQELDLLTDRYQSAQQEISGLKDQIKDLQNQTSPDDSTEKIKIYIDQGHNPMSHHNSGASGNGLYEEDLTFSIGLLLAELLEADGRFEICLSRPTADTVLGTDNDSSLDARVEGAKDFGADYFISLHLNSYEDAAANGIEVYVANQDSESYDFGNSLLQGMVNATNLRNRGMKVNSNLRVLKNATMPAALLEMGFISNAADAALLSEHSNLFAEGVYNGILAYFEPEANSDATN